MFCRLSIAVLYLIPVQAISQSVPINIRTPEYRELQRNLATGWNTWYNNSVISHVLLPHGFAINLCLEKPGTGALLRETFKASAIQQRQEQVLLGLRADDGSYTSMTVKYEGEELAVQSATDGKDELILVTPANGAKNLLIVEAGVLWNKEGTIGMAQNKLNYHTGNTDISVSATAIPTVDAYAVTTTPHLTFSLDQEIGIYTGRQRTIAEIRSIIEKRHAEQQQRMTGYGNMAESFTAMQTILAWNTTYDAPNKRVLTPVSRNWSHGWGGFVLFDWDNYFASYMFSMFNKNLAYANAVEITKAITPNGFIPNYQAPFGKTSFDRSEPPIGSLVVLDIYKKYQEKWFLIEVYDELLSWNRWWSQNRDVKGYLCWGSQSHGDNPKDFNGTHNIQAAMYESGLDNSPMYDGVPFNPKNNTMELADVGLMSLYIADCKSLSAIATILNKPQDAKELNKRADVYSKKLATMWDEKTGIFLNKRMDTGEKSYKMSPTNFYPMLAKACTERQAERMIKEHYYNPGEFYGKYVMPSIARNDPGFKDNDYWRGRIWGPMNFLVYLGMRNYHLETARADLISKSKALLMQNWKKDGGVYENYNAVTGDGSDVKNADGFYHWGALLTYMDFLENAKPDTTTKP